MNQANIISYDLDANGNIRVWTQYIINDVEQVGQYPKIDGKNVFCSRYTALNFHGMDTAAIKARIKQDLDQHLSTLITREYTKVANDDLLKTLSFLDGEKVEKETATIKFVVGEEEITKEVKADGTQVSETTKPKPTVGVIG